MNFKCKCGSTKYRQISTLVKQCEECGRQTQSEGIVDERLDFTEDVDITKKKLSTKYKPFNFRSTNMTGSSTFYYVDPDLWFI